MRSWDREIMRSWGREIMRSWDHEIVVLQWHDVAIVLEIVKASDICAESYVASSCDLG